MVAAELQCGHDPKAVENQRNACQLLVNARSFNAATTRRPWRTTCSGYVDEAG